MPDFDTEEAARKPYREALTDPDWGIVKEIIGQFPAAIHWTKNNASTALHYAAANGATGMAAWLLDHQADIDCANDGGDTALYCAISCGHSETISLLLERGAQIELKNDMGETALMHAIRQSVNSSRGAPCVALLLEHGANLDTVNSVGQGPEKLARGVRQTGVIRMVVAATARQAEEKKQKMREQERLERIEMFRNGLDEPVKVFARPVVPRKRGAQNAAP